MVNYAHLHHHHRHHRCHVYRDKYLFRIQLYHCFTFATVWANSADDKLVIFFFFIFPENRLYGDLVYRFRKIVGKSNFSEQFRKLINRYKRIGYSLDIMRQTACLVVNPIIVDGYASLFNCTTPVRALDSMTASS